jgi:hypothetical protein
VASATAWSAGPAGRDLSARRIVHRRGAGLSSDVRRIIGDGLCSKLGFGRLTRLYSISARLRGNLEHPQRWLSSNWEFSMMTVPAGVSTGVPQRVVLHPHVVHGHVALPQAGAHIRARVVHVAGVKLVPASRAGRVAGEDAVVLSRWPGTARRGSGFGAVDDDRVAVHPAQGDAGLGDVHAARAALVGVLVAIAWAGQDSVAGAGGVDGGLDGLVSGRPGHRTSRPAGPSGRAARPCSARLRGYSAWQGQLRCLAGRSLWAAMCGRPQAPAVARPGAERPDLDGCRVTELDLAAAHIGG